jgi:uncharacterized protein (TIGR02145 family)
MKMIHKIYGYPIIVIGIFLLLTASCKKDDDNKNNPPANTVTDIDGNVYQTVTIGNQVWMRENLKVTKYRNGDPIPNITDGLAWSNLTTGAYCDYANIPGNSTTYGKLYNWHAVNDSRNIAPSGWHVPTDEEWTTLTNYLGGEDIAGGKLKETGTAHWQGSNIASNESGFTAIPGGGRGHDSDGTFLSIGNTGFWWSSIDSGTGYAWLRVISGSESYIQRNCWNIENGFSVRCLKD